MKDRDPNNPKLYDLRPKTFVKKMKWEILVFGGSILFGIFGKTTFI